MENREKSLDKIFEEASLEILTTIFKEWGFVIYEPKIQHSGTQHGFDVFMKIQHEHSPFPLNLYIECKHSQQENLTLPINKLLEKSSQLNWADFTKKDFHIFFSAVVCVSGSNQQTGIEINDYPFIIIDWMRKPRKSNRNLIMELFYTYTGNSVAIKQYREFLQVHLKNDFTSSMIFQDIAKDLYNHFQQRIENYYAGQSRTSDFYFFSGSFLNFEKKRTETSRLPDFYTHTNSNIIRLLQVVANDYYIPIEGEFPVLNEKNGTRDSMTIEVLIDQLSKNTPTLLKILSSPGQGKSTFLLHIARTFFQKYHIFYLTKINNDVLSKLLEVMEKLNPGLPLILMLDNTEAHEDELAEHMTKWVRCFYQNGLVFITAERIFRYQHMEKAKDFESPFEEHYTLEFTTPEQDKEKIFTNFIKYLDEEKKLTASEIEECRHRYLDSSLSTADSAFRVISYLKKNNRLERYTFDWEDWEHFISTHKLYESLDNLFLKVATFYQFNIPITDTFCARGNIDLKRKINKALGPDSQLPISKKENVLYLRHELIADWYFHEEGYESDKRREDARSFFIEFLKNIDNEECKKFFTKIHRKQEFRNSFLGDLIDDKSSEKLLANYVSAHPEEFKARNELGKIYISQGRYEEAERVLKEAIEIEASNKHSRTELGKIYQKLEKYEEAERVLKEIIKIDNNDIHSHTELGKVYQKLEKWEEAERVLKEIIKIDHQNIHSRTELGKVYQKLEKWEEAERVLKEAIEIDNTNIPPHTELGKVYQKMGKWEEAERVLKEAITIAPRSIPARVVLGRLYYRFNKWKDYHNTLKSIPIHEIKGFAREEWAKALVELGKRTNVKKEKHFYFEQAYRLLSGIKPKTRKISKTLTYISRFIGR